ncbi:MAG: sigma-70 family RNA polymerase sigma factor [Planctomycetes bacterium]|nr:sigma-70 family RNA polymerase sigma factor [Planctomycetota bacterium]
MNTHEPGEVPDTTAGTEEDRRLVLLAREGDRAAFSGLVRKYSGLVRALVRARLGRRAEGEDAAQDVFLLAWQRLPSLAEPDRFAGWVSTIAVNRALEVLRRDGRRRTASLEATEVDPPDVRPLDASLPNAERDEEREQMFRCLSRLDERTQAVLVLRFREGRAVKDIAASLGEQPPAVAMRISRALRKLRELMEEGAR